MADKIILSYHDEILYSSDLDILRERNSYMNDRLISFFFTHIALSTPSDYFFCPPSISFLISLFPTQEIVSPLNLPDKSLVFFPINDNDNPELPNGGTHWSLLVFSRKIHAFVHYDSLGGLNAKCARRLFLGVKDFVGREGVDAEFVEGNVGWQTNGHDCGLWVMEVARVILQKCERGEEEDIVNLEKEINVEKIGQLRGEILDLVLKLIQDLK